jgi:hypothetical protein
VIAETAAQLTKEAAKPVLAPIAKVVASAGEGYAIAVADGGRNYLVMDAWGAKGHTGYPLTGATGRGTIAGNEQDSCASRDGGRPAPMAWAFRGVSLACRIPCGFSPCRRHAAPPRPLPCVAPEAAARNVRPQHRVPLCPRPSPPIVTRTR